MKLSFNRGGAKVLQTVAEGRSFHFAPKTSAFSLVGIGAWGRKSLAAKEFWEYTRQPHLPPFLKRCDKLSWGRWLRGSPASLVLDVIDANLIRTADGIRRN